MYPASFLDIKISETKNNLEKALRKDDAEEFDKILWAELEHPNAIQFYLLLNLFSSKVTEDIMKYIIWSLIKMSKIDNKNTDKYTLNMIISISEYSTILEEYSIDNFYEYKKECVWTYNVLDESMAEEISDSSYDYEDIIKLGTEYMKGEDNFKSFLEKYYPSLMY